MEPRHGTLNELQPVRWKQTPDKEKCIQSAISKFKQEYQELQKNGIPQRNNFWWHDFLKHKYILSALHFIRFRLHFLNAAWSNKIITFPFLYGPRSNKIRTSNLSVASSTECSCKPCQVIMVCRNLVVPCCQNVGASCRLCTCSFLYKWENC